VIRFDQGIAFRIDFNENHDPETGRFSVGAADEHVRFSARPGVDHPIHADPGMVHMRGGLFRKISSREIEANKVAKEASDKYEALKDRSTQEESEKAERFAISMVNRAAKKEEEANAEFLSRHPEHDRESSTEKKQRLKETTITRKMRAKSRGIPWSEDLDI
jgi:hypothetical protein